MTGWPKKTSLKLHQAAMKGLLLRIRGKKRSTREINYLGSAERARCNSLTLDKKGAIDRGRFSKRALPNGVNTPAGGIPVWR